MANAFVQRCVRVVCRSAGICIHVFGMHVRMPVYGSRYLIMPLNVKAFVRSFRTQQWRCKNNTQKRLANCGVNCRQFRSSFNDDLFIQVALSISIGNVINFTSHFVSQWKKSAPLFLTGEHNIRWTSFKWIPQRFLSFSSWWQTRINWIYTFTFRYEHMYCKANLLEPHTSNIQTLRNNSKRIYACLRLVLRINHFNFHIK